MPNLAIRHNGDLSFCVIRLSDGTEAPAADLPDPYEFPVEGRPNSNLMAELRWYLEDFLGYPYNPETEKADRVLAAMRGWGQQAFKALFDNRAAGGFLNDATQKGQSFDDLNVLIRSDHPAVLSWPWEALYDSAVGGELGKICRVERRLNITVDPAAIPEQLPKDRINILLVTARPFEGDVRYRSISSKLVELVSEEKLPATVTLLRPPTFKNLRNHLDQNPGRYHIVHFDGHGAFGQLPDENESTNPADRHRYQKGPQGHLAFEDEEGELDLVKAEVFSDLLRDKAIPMVVLNACQSAMVDAQGEDPFSSVAASLLRAGIRSVVAMAYSLYVSGAQEFLPEFYRHLFKKGDAAEAVRKGRQQMYAQQGRVCRRGRYPLLDWLVPVVLQQQPMDLSFASQSGITAEETEPCLPDEALDQGPYGFIGRDNLLLELERAIRRRPGAVLINGIGGVGKTALAQGFLRWLDDTGGLGTGSNWIRFTEDIRSAEYILNLMGGPLLGEKFLALPVEAKVSMLIKLLREYRMFVVWDNFEVAAGMPGTTLKPSLGQEQLDLLRRLVEGIKGGQAKIIITSRGGEDWLGRENRVKLNVGGLDGEERWEFLNQVVRDLGLKINREDPDLAELIDRLGGHPLSMQVVLPLLEDRTPSALLAMFDSSLDEINKASGEDVSKFFATLNLAEQCLPKDLLPLLLPLSLHERFMDTGTFSMMAQRVDPSWTRERIDNFADTLANMGLLRLRIPDFGAYEMHPALGSYLRTNSDATTLETWFSTFVDVMWQIADSYALKELHEQRAVFTLHGANFRRALEEATYLEVTIAQAALTQALGFYALNTLNWNQARMLFEDLLNIEKKRGHDIGEASACHQLGMIAQAQRDFKSAKNWYMKAVTICDRCKIELFVANTYHQLGIIAQKQSDFKNAKNWYLKALKLDEKQGNEAGAAYTYHQLGIIAQEQNDFNNAKNWYLKALKIKERLGNELGATSTYHHLGMIAQEQKDYEDAEKWYRKALEINERLGNEAGAANTYHLLGTTAREQKHFNYAKEYFLKSLEISEKLVDESSAAITYHQLGLIAQEQRDFKNAEKWYKKALKIEERLGNQTSAASIYRRLGKIAEGQRDFKNAERWYRKVLDINERLNDQNGTALACGQMGIFYSQKGEHQTAGEWLIRTATTFHQANDPHNTMRATYDFYKTIQAAPPAIAAELKSAWNQAGLPDWGQMATAIEEQLSKAEKEE